MLLFAVFTTAQEQAYPVVAEQGDGIFSILRKQGLDPVKFYARFVALNENNLKNGSGLYLGKEYLIPYSADSFKEKAKNVVASDDSESALFDLELASIAPKSEHLKHAVIYLISNTKGTDKSGVLQRLGKEITVTLAQELMVHGAQVYIIDNPDKESGISGYVDAVNTRYLKNQGKYQRLLMINLNEGMTKSGYFDVSVFHHDNNEDGERFAKNIQQILNKHRIESDARKAYTEVFTDSENLYLAKNVLPAITLIDIGNSKDPSIESRISIRNDQQFISDIIANGVMNDYANLAVETN
ncbi:hypothetical protein ABV409_06345 [Flagellimonas sp. DF-77]|uniref:hypothetical protein n=1 Tax=Flagellimonas algarum TaxID=3230298 RepID=UPI0033937853